MPYCSGNTSKKEPMTVFCLFSPLTQAMLDYAHIDRQYIISFWIHTVTTMQWLSRIAPQQPKKAITNMIAPMIMNTHGATVKCVLSSSDTSVQFSLTATPMPMTVRPRSCEEKIK